MLPAISPTTDPVLQKNFAAIREVLGGGLSFDNMNIQVISGTTAGTPDTQKQVIHSMTPRPIGWFPLVGDVYIQEISNKFVDVRSTKPGVNFKIILVGGAPVTGGDLLAIGDSSYVPTAAPLSSETTSGGSLVYGECNYFVTKGCQGAVQHVIATPSHLYITTSNTTDKNALLKVNRSSGEIERLSLAGGGVQLGPIYNDGSSLWVVEKTNGTNAYKVDITTFTLSATIPLSYTNNVFGQMNDVRDVYVDGAFIWILGNNGPTSTPGNGFRFNKNNAVTGAEVGYFLPSGATYGKQANQIASDGNYFYFMQSGGGGNVPIHAHRVNKGFTGSLSVPGAQWSVASHTLAGASFRAQNCILFDNSIYTVALTTSLISSANAYSGSVVQYNYSNFTFSQYPIFIQTYDIPFVGTTDGPLSIELKAHQNFLYILFTGSKVGSTLTQLTIFDLEQKDSITYIYPIFIPTTGGTLFTVNKGLLLEPETGAPLFFKSPTDAGPSDHNFTIIQPTF